MTAQPSTARRAPGVAEPPAGLGRRQQAQPLRPDERLRRAQARQQTL